ncbi:MAG: nitrite reductase [Candidatus Electrothrix sp. ATG2]|nr:nitrite reductase [Candidatus Electrothrix sp. ATG2]
MENHKTFCPMPDINAGMLTLKNLEQVTELAQKYEVPMLKVTGGQRLFFQGLEPEKLAALKQELSVPATPPHARNRVNYVQACPGKNWCSCGTAATEPLTKALMDMELDGPLPAKVKVGISGCVRCCCESWMRDIGLTAEKKGWRLTFGGNAASKPRIGDVLADGLTDDQAVELVRTTLEYYKNTAKPKTRTARFVERIGIEELKQNVLG